MRWAVLALLGIVLASAAAYGASQLASQPVGLSSEPITAGRQLAPRPDRTRTPAPAPRRTPTVAQVTPAPATPVPTPVTGGDDNEGRDDDRHSGDD